MSEHVPIIQDGPPIDDIIELPCGPIRVEVDEFGMLTARGIKYAECKRFKPCTPVTPWTEVRDCTGPSVIPPQNPSAWEPVTGPLDWGRTQSEDCLELTICSGPEIDDKHAVMVFIHGGGNMTGGGDLDVYNPKRLARYDDVVVVNVSSRLGVFGYLKLDDVVENIGLLDQVEALKWVQNNIEGFGGDPDRITVFGQGEGADSIMCLMVSSDITKGLLHRSILQSLPFGLREKKNFDEMRAELSKMATSFLAEFDNDHSAPSTEEWLAQQEKMTDQIGQKYDISTPFVPVCGAHPMPPEDELLDRLVAAAEDIPTMIGWTADEYKNELHPEADTTIDMFKKGADELRLAEQYVDLGIPSASYIFKWHPEESEKYKAVHGIEMPFLLGDWGAWKDAPMLQGEVPEDVRQKIGGNMKHLWTDFALGADVGDVRFVIDENFKYEPQPDM